ncbi:putative GTPase Rho1 [Cristinia sonorae]|uniref:GTPase Rho1 n=1 Tax=Cristinia sonorae TaxID=1940300 RepID=A0A8K0UX12_9AGAR|nr:putative GTPase Rho1 [Cristinia sonorae]
MLEASTRTMLVCGDTGCGKTCFLLAHFNNSFPEGTIPATLIHYTADVDIDDGLGLVPLSVPLATIDSQHNPYDDRVRQRCSYRAAHVVIVCFAIDDPGSLKSVEDTWIGEVNHYAPGIPVILLGCKKDTRPITSRNDATIIDDDGTVTYEQGLAVSNKINAAQYMECSAKTGEGVQEVFQCAARVALKVKRRKRFLRRCVVL